MGRDEDGLVQPMTLMFRMVEFQYEAFDRYVQEHPDQWHGVFGLTDLIRRATQAGELQMPREDMLFFGTPHEHEVSINSTHGRPTARHPRAGSPGRASAPGRQPGMMCDLTSEV